MCVCAFIRVSVRACVFVSVCVILCSKFFFLDDDNDYFYGPAKSQREIVCIPVCTKMTNTNKSDRFRILYCSLS
jgi:hypothetical protein